MFKKIAVIAVLLGLVAPATAERLSTDTRAGSKPSEGWLVYALNNDVDTAFEFVAETNTGFMTVDDNLEVLSSSGSDNTQLAVVVGVQTDGSLAAVKDTLNGTTPVTLGTAAQFHDVHAFWLEQTGSTAMAEPAGNVTLRDATADATLRLIAAGKTNHQACLYFAGTKGTTFVEGWQTAVTTSTGTNTFELRLYHDFEDTRDIGDGYEVLDVVALPNAVAAPEPRVFPRPIAVPRGGFIAVYSVSSAVNAQHQARVFGYRR